MINTVIFDYGNTLARYDQEELGRMYAANPEDASLLCEVAFSRYYWDRLDEGTLSNDEWIADAKKHLPPHLQALVPIIATTWHKRLPIIDGMQALVDSLRHRGVKLYLLSNISEFFYEHHHEIEILKDFDGILCSATVKAVKPNPEIYEILIDRYHLATNSCVFIDDRQDNLDAAAAFGIHTYLFDGDADRLSRYLDTVL